MTQEIEILQFLHYNTEATRAEIGSALSNGFMNKTISQPFKRIFIDQFLFRCKDLFLTGQIQHRKPQPHSFTVSRE